MTFQGKVLGQGEKLTFYRNLSAAILKAHAGDRVQNIIIKREKEKEMEVDIASL